MPTRPPVAVVALGDPKRHDDALAIRVMGRVRTLIAELGINRAAGGPAPRGRTTHTDSGRKGRAATAAYRLWDKSQSRRHGGALTVVGRPAGAALIDWIEGGTEQAKLDAVLGERRRVILMDAVRLTGKAGQVHHWHLKCGGSNQLSALRHYTGRFQGGMQHLGLWLEDELPENGTDLIGIEPHDLSEGEGLSRPIRTRLSIISSEVAGVLVRILEEEGW